MLSSRCFPTIPPSVHARSPGRTRLNPLPAPLPDSIMQLTPLGFKYIDVFTWKWLRMGYALIMEKVPKLDKVE